MKDELLELCIKQGYVHKECKLLGDLVFALINSGKNPCEGCNANCSHKRLSREESERFEKEYEERLNEKIKEDKEKEQRINKRIKSGIPKSIMYINIDYHDVDISVVKLFEENMFCKSFNSLQEAIHLIPIICNVYEVNQIIMDTRGYGKYLTDEIYRRIEKYNMDIDFVPMESKRMILDNVVNDKKCKETICLAI